MNTNILAEILRETAKAVRTNRADGTWGHWGCVREDELASHAFNNEMSDIVSHILYDVYCYTADELGEPGSPAFPVAMAANVIQLLLSEYLCAHPDTKPSWACEMLEYMADGMGRIPKSRFEASLETILSPARGKRGKHRKVS